MLLSILLRGDSVIQWNDQLNYLIDSGSCLCFPFPEGVKKKWMIDRCCSVFTKAVFLQVLTSMAQCLKCISIFIHLFIFASDIVPASSLYLQSGQYCVLPFITNEATTFFVSKMQKVYLLLAHRLFLDVNKTLMSQLSFLGKKNCNLSSLTVYTK